MTSVREFLTGWKDHRDPEAAGLGRTLQEALTEALGSSPSSPDAADRLSASFDAILRMPSLHRGSQNFLIAEALRKSISSILEARKKTEGELRDQIAGGVRDAVRTAIEDRMRPIREAEELRDIMIALVFRNPQTRLLCQFIGETEKASGYRLAIELIAPKEGSRESLCLTEKGFLVRHRTTVAGTEDTFYTLDTKRILELGLTWEALGPALDRALETVAAQGEKALINFTYVNTGM